MAFVKTPRELGILKRELTATEFTNGRRLTVEFLTDPDVYRGLIPPGLEPMEEPRIVVGVGTWDSNSIGHYEGGSISLAVRRDGIPGGYAVSMWMDTDAAVAFGRDVYGEPKRKADAVELVREDSRVRASIDRRGVRIIELDAVLERNLGPLQADRYAYNIRSRPSVDAFHLDGPAVITRATFATSARLRLEGHGRILFRSSELDPVESIPVIQTIRAEYQEHDVAASAEVAGSIDPEAFLPFHYGRQDDFFALRSTAQQAP